MKLTYLSLFASFALLLSCGNDEKKHKAFKNANIIKTQTEVAYQFVDYLKKGDRTAAVDMEFFPSTFASEADNKKIRIAELATIDNAIDYLKNHKLIDTPWDVVADTANPTATSIYAKFKKNSPGATEMQMVLDFGSLKSDTSIKTFSLETTELKLSDTSRFK